MGGDYDAALSAFAGKRALSSTKVKFFRKANPSFIIIKLYETFYDI